MKAKHKRMTNTQKVREIMEFSKYGALAQMFIIDAISTAANKVAETTPDQYKKEDWGFVSVEAWIGVAKEIKGKLEEHFKL